MLPGNTYYREGFTAAWFLCSILVAYASFDRGYVFEVPVLGRVLEYLGARSYALYMLHIPMRHLADAIAQRQPRLAQFAEHYPGSNWFIYVLAVLALSEVTWRLLEWPLQKYGRRLTKQALPHELAGTPAAPG